MDPNPYFIFSLVLIGNSLKNLMCLIQMYVGHVLKVYYIYQSTPCGNILDICKS